MQKATSSFSAIFFKDGRLRPYLRVLLYVLAVITAFEILAAAALWLAAGFGYQPSRWDLVALEVVLSAGIVLALAVLLRRHVDQRSVESLGLPLRGPWQRMFGLGVVFGAGMQVTVYVLERLFGHVQVVRFGTLEGAVKLVAVAAVIFLMAALTEEMSVRGYILQNLWEEWGFAPAAIVSSLIFALLHFGNPHVHENMWLTAAGLTTFALWACLSVLWTKSLWLALGCHAAWNIFEGPVFGFPVSGLQMPAQPLMSVTSGAPDWFTGGNFGPEAGLSSIITMLAGTAVLWLLATRGVFARATDARESYARGR